MTSLFQAQQSVADLFFKNRLNKEIETVLEKYIKFQARLSEEVKLEFVKSLKDLEKVLQEIAYLEKGDAIQLALSHEQVLQYLHNFLREIRNKKQESAETEVAIKPIESVPRQQVIIQPSAARPVQKLHKIRKNLNETQEKILEFVRRVPDRRTKDVINQFSALSQRTIKRGLKELNKEGRIIKRIESGAVYYSAV